jgi:MoaA/NifB/PqqE/SkfB family radical SAM enzyme
MKRKDLSKKELEKIIDKLYSLGNRCISFFGGEPTIRKDFVSLVRYARKKGFITHLSTNGTLLTPRYIRSLAQGGIDVINLSVDSVLETDGSKKNYVRSKKVLKDLLAARKKYGFVINVNLVLTSQNIESVIETIKLISGFGIPISSGLINEDPAGKMRSPKSLFFRTKSQKEKLFRVIDEILALKKNGANIIEPREYFEGIKKFVKGESDWYCAAGEYHFTVDCDGKFQFCAALPDEDFTIFDIDKDYFSKLAGLRKKRLAKCKPRCFANCHFAASYFIKHPFYFLRELF